MQKDVTVDVVKVSYQQFGGDCLMLRYSMILATLFFVVTLHGCGGGGGSSSSSQTAQASSASWAGLSIISASQQVTLGWTKNSKSTTKNSSYTIYWSTTPGVTSKTGVKISGVLSPYIHTGLTNDVMHYYVVTETVDGIEGPESLEVAVTPKAALPPVPGGITISPLDSRNQIKITRSSIPNIKYHLYWSSGEDLSRSNKVVNAFGAGTTFVHTGLTNGTPYYYSVSSEIPDGESVKSQLLLAVPRADTPAVDFVAGLRNPAVATPNSVVASAGNQKVTLTWNMPVNTVPMLFNPASTPTVTPIVVSEYRIYWSKNFISDLSQVNTISFAASTKIKPPYTFEHNTDLSNNSPYYYLIAAVAATDGSGTSLVDANGVLLSFESSTGSQVAVVPVASTPVAPTGLTVTSGTQQVVLKWNKNSSANATYRVYAADRAPQKPDDLVVNAVPVVSTSATTYTHTGLKNGSTYYYVVTAVDEEESLPSALASVAVW